MPNYSCDVIHFNISSNGETIAEGFSGCVCLQTRHLLYIVNDLAVNTEVFLVLINKQPWSCI